MNLNDLEKQRERKLRMKIKHSIEKMKLVKQIRKNNEDQLKEKLGIQKTLEEFHKPVTQEIEKYEKSNKDVVKSIQDAVENISLDTSYSFDALRLMDKAEGITKFYSDRNLDIPFIKSENLELPSELVNKSATQLDEIITKAKEKRDQYKRMKGTHTKNYNISKDENDNRKLMETDYKMNMIKEYIKVLNVMKEASPYIGEGLDSLDKLTDKICKSDKIPKKLYNQVVLLLDILLKNGTMTDSDVQRYHRQFFP